MSMASKYSRGFESAARWPKTTSSRWSCVGAGRESRGADQRVSARRTRAGGRRRRRRLKRMWEKHASVCGHDKTRGGETHRQVIHGRFLGRTHAPAGAPVVLVPFRGDERPAFRGRPRVRAVSARHAPPRDPSLVSHRRFSQFLARRARRRAARRGGARALAHAPEAPRSPHSPSDDTHRASDAAKECRSMTRDTRERKEKEEERAFDKES